LTSLVAAGLVAGTLVAHAQSALPQAWGGSVSAVEGNGNGYTNAENLAGILSINSSNFSYNSEVGGFMNTNASVTVTAGGQPATYKYLALGLQIGGNDSHGKPQDILTITWAHNYTDLVNGVNIITVTFPDGTYNANTMSNIQSSLQAGLSNTVSYSDSYDNYFWISDDSGCNYVKGNLSTFGPMVSPAPSPSLALFGTNVAISWPTNTSGYSLCRCSSLFGTNWTAVTNSPATNGGLYRVVLPREGSMGFFRLQR
jgi:hypothetical protein